MKIVCPACGELVEGKDIDLGRGLAVCRPCGEVVPLPQSVRVDRRGVLVVEGSAVHLAQEIARLPIWAYRPEALPVTERRAAGRVDLSVGQSRSAGAFALLVALIWCAFLWLWITFLRSSDGSILGGLRFLFPVLHAASGLFLLYSALRMLANHAALSLTATRVSLAYGPLPQGGGFSEPLRNVRCFVEAQQFARALHERWFYPAISFTVAALLRDNRSITLDLHLPERDHARYVALRLNRALDELQAGQARPGTDVAELDEDGETP